MTAFAPRVVLPLALLAAATLSAHFAWVDTVPGILEPGRPAQIRIGSGHDLAASESAISLQGTQLWALAPSGAKTSLKPTVEGNWVTASYGVKETGVHRFVMTQDRGIISQTTKGYKPGGRDAYPDAKKSMKIWRSASSVAWTQGSKFSGVKPLGLDFELIAEPVAEGLALTVLRGGRPEANAQIAIGLPGKDDDEDVGKSDRSGRFVYKFPAGFKGPIAFLATVADPSPKGSNFDTANYTAVLHINR